MAGPKLVCFRNDLCEMRIPLTFLRLKLLVDILFLFSQILGQKRPVEFLKRTMARKKMPHAYLFTGIPGIGKTSTAMALVMALNCRDPINGEGCGECPSCRQMIDGNLPDFLTIKPDGQNIKIDQIRALKQSLRFAPVSGKYRVCVIYQAATMTDEAANSFLKTLEEPPPGNILILNATEPRDLFPTIVSRCRQVRFQPLSVRDIINWLVKKKEINKESAEVLAQVALGSLGQALKMCESDFLEKRLTWLATIIKLSGLSREECFKMALNCANEAKKMDTNMNDNGHAGVLDMLFVWESWYRDLLLVKLASPLNLLINVDFSHKLKKKAEGCNLDDLIGNILIIDQAQRNLRRNRNTSLVIEHTILNLTRFAGHGREPFRGKR